MEVDGPEDEVPEIPGRWNHVKKLLERRGPFTHINFDPSLNNLALLQNRVKILVIGAGGLGCELLKNLAEKSKPNASKSMGVFLQNLQKDESKNQSNGHNKEDKAPIDNKPIVRQPVDELDELKWAKDSYFIGDGLIGRLEKVPDIKEKLDKMKKELNLRLKSKDKERVCYLYDRSRKQLKAPVHSTVKKVVLSIGSQDLFTDPLLTLKQASKQEVKEANESKLKERATHIKALIQALMGKNMEKKVVYIIPTTCIERKEVFEHFEEIITETLKDLPFPNFKLINFPELMYNQNLQDDLQANSKIFLIFTAVKHLNH